MLSLRSFRCVARSWSAPSLSSDRRWMFGCPLAGSFCRLHSLLHPRLFSDLPGTLPIVPLLRTAQIGVDHSMPDSASHSSTLVQFVCSKSVRLIQQSKNLQETANTKIVLRLGGGCIQVPIYGPPGSAPPSVPIATPMY